MKFKTSIPDWHWENMYTKNVRLCGIVYHMNWCDSTGPMLDIIKYECCHYVSVLGDRWQEAPTFVHQNMYYYFYTENFGKDIYTKYNTKMLHTMARE